MNSNLTEFYGDPIHVYTRAQAIEDGVLIDASVGDLIDASVGDLAALSREHYRYPMAMTAAVWGLIEKAVANKKHCNDLEGVWHDVLWMSHQQSAVVQRFDPTSHLFRVIITGTGTRKTDGLEWHTLKAVCGPGDNAEPVITIMMPEED